MDGLDPALPGVFVRMHDVEAAPHHHHDSATTDDHDDDPALT